MNNQVPAVITKGSTTTLTISLEKDGCCEPFPLPGFISATAKFSAEIDADSPIELAGSLVSEDRGIISVLISAANADLLAPGDNQSFQLDVVLSSGKIVVVFEGAISVVPQLFP